jgi:signal transduction histidine kinase
VPDQDKPLIDAERLRSVLQQAPLTLLVSIINAVLSAIVFAPVAGGTVLSLWVASIVVISLVRAAIRRRLLAATPGKIAPGSMAAISVAGSAATGMLWGAGAVFLSPNAEVFQLFFAFVIGGMCAGTSSVNSAHAPTVLAFILPASLPLAGRFLAEGSPPLLVSGLMTLLFAVALTLNSLRAHRNFGDRIRLQLALGRQSVSLREANERLHDEVAERLKVEATLHQAQKMEAIGHLTGGVAHDFNNLLQVVTGSLSLIGRLAEDDPRILGHVRNAEQAVAQGARLNGSLLAFARREAIRVERKNINDLLREFQPILARAIDDRIRFEVAMAPDLPDCHADPAHFQSAILNIVINARDAMPNGGALSITTGETTLEAGDLLGNDDASPGQFVCISVQDNGSGMTKEVQARVFEPFFTTKELGKGSGLGLSQVYGFARQSGGHVTLRSTPGAGTCIMILLPAAVVAT